MKYGLIDGEPGTSDTNLRWEVGGVSKWNVTFAAGVWHNIAYAIDFDAETVEFYHSTGSDALKSTAGPFPATTSSVSLACQQSVIFANAVAEWCRLASGRSTSASCERPD